MTLVVSPRCRSGAAHVQNVIPNADVLRGTTAAIGRVGVRSPGQCLSLSVTLSTGITEVGHRPDTAWTGLHEAHGWLAGILAGAASSGGGHIMLELTPGTRPTGALVAWVPRGGGAAASARGFAPQRVGSRAARHVRGTLAA